MRKQTKTALALCTIVAMHASQAFSQCVTLPVTEGQRVVQVRSSSELRNALSSAQPGNVITLANGTYSGNFTFGRSGKSGEPVIIRAENGGSAVFRNANITLSGDYNVLMGATLDNSQVTIRGDNNRVSRNLFRNGSASASDRYVLIHGQGNRIDHNDMGNSARRGITVRMAGGKVPSGNRIDHNYIHDFRYNQKANQGEAIQIGTNKNQHPLPFNTVIEYNLIERVEADSEGLSLKSSGNIVRFNTIQNSDANVTIRGGSNNQIVGNTINGMNAVVVYGKDNRIVGNHLRNTYLIVRAGTTTYAESIRGVHGWSRSEGAYVAGNRLEGGYIGVGTRVPGGSKRTGKDAIDTTLAGNTGRVEYGDHQGTRTVQNAENAPAATTVSRSMVGANAAGDGASGGECPSGAIPPVTDSAASGGGSPVVDGPACELPTARNSYYVSPSGNGNCSQESPCSLSGGLQRANAGDEVILLDGEYRGCIDTVRDGTMQNPITIRAQNTHGPLFRGNGSNSRSNCGINVRHSNLIIMGLRFEGHYGAIWGDSNRASNVEVRDNLISHFSYDGIRLRGRDWHIHNNVIGLSQQTAGDNGAGVSLRGNTHNNQIVNNVVYAINNDSWQVSPPVNASKYGLCFNIFAPASNNLIQGNICMAAEKSNMTIWTAEGSTHTNTNNVVRDNIWAYSEGGGFSPRDKRSNNNSFVNNLCYSTHNCAGGKGNVPGNNEILHNTTIVTEFSGPVAYSSGKDSGTYDESRIFKSNLAFSAVEHGVSHDNYLSGVQNANATYGNRHTHNLYWAPWSQENLVWSREGPFSLSSTDVVAQPQFVNPAAGDFTLADGSPGKGAGHDGADIGMRWNAHLTLGKFQSVFGLPTQTQDTPGTSATFSGLDAGREYQVYAYVPERGFYTGTEIFQVEGNRLPRDLGFAFNGSKWYSGKWYSGANRWIALGNHAVSSDGVLNVKWQHANAASRIFIRAFPTSQEAYTWVMGCVPPNLEIASSPPPAPAPEEEAKRFPWSTVISGGAAATAIIGSRLLSAPRSTVDEMGMLTAIDGSCIDYRVLPFACATPFWPDCSVVTYRLPVLAVEVIKIPGDTVIDGGTISSFVGRATSAIAKLFNVLGLMGGGGAGTASSQSNRGNLHFYHVHVWGMPDILCSSPCNICGTNESTFKPIYFSEGDPHWPSAEFTSPLLISALTDAFRLSPMGSWQQLGPVQGQVVQSSPHVAAAVAAFRGMFIGAFPAATMPPRPILSPGPSTLCMQQAWPTKKRCILAGTPPVVWDMNTYAPYGKYLFYFWKSYRKTMSYAEAQRQSACVKVPIRTLFNKMRPVEPSLSTCILP